MDKAPGRLRSLHTQIPTHDTNDCTFLKNAAKNSGNPKRTKSKNQTWKRDANKKTNESKKDLAAFIAKKVKAEINAFHKPRKTDKKRKADLNAIEINSKRLRLLFCCGCYHSGLDSLGVKSSASSTRKKTACSLAPQHVPPYLWSVLHCTSTARQTRDGTLEFTDPEIRDEHQSFFQSQQPQRHQDSQSETETSTENRRHQHLSRQLYRQKAKDRR